MTPNDTAIGAAQPTRAQARRAQARAEAAELVAGGYHTLTAIAAGLGIGRRQLYNWRRRPDFAARVAAIRAAYRDELLQRSRTGRGDPRPANAAAIVTGGG